MKELIAGAVVLGALTFSVAESNPVPVPVNFGETSAPVGVIPESLKLRLGGFAKKGSAEGKGRRKYKAPPIPGLPKAS